MKRLIFFSLMLLLFGACRTQSFSCRHENDRTPFILRDSISITYKQGALLTPQGITLQVPTTRNNENPNQPSSPRASPSIEQVVREDTVFIERWHTQTIREPTPPPPGGGREGASKFYKNCTKGFWILLILLFGRIAFRIFRLFYLRR